MTHLHEMLFLVNQEIMKEEQRVYEGIQECARTKMSMHPDYWKKLWQLNQKRLAILQVIEAFRDDQ